MSKEEFHDLKWCIGEYRRICREQIKSEIANQRLQVAESLLGYLDQVEWQNKTIK